MKKKEQVWLQNGFNSGKAQLAAINFAIAAKSSTK